MMDGGRYQAAEPPARPCQTFSFAKREAPLPEQGDIGFHNMAGGWRKFGDRPDFPSRSCRWNQEFRMFLQAFQHGIFPALSDRK